MTPDLDHLYALGGARSCLAALADIAVDEGESGHYERLLIALDVIDPDGPATWPISDDRPELLSRLEMAVDTLIDLGGDPTAFDLIVTLAGAPIRAN